MSYDDGIHQDKRFISLLKKYGLQCTFNINSGQLGATNWFDFPDRRVDHIRFKEEELPIIYNGFEIACHTKNHPCLDACAKEKVIDEVLGDQQNLEHILGCKITGMAYPNGNFYTEQTIQIILENTSIRYARTIADTLSFEFPKRLMEWHPTCYHIRDEIFELAEKFIKLSPEEDALFYLWGHSYEFDFTDDGWSRIEKFMQLISNRKDIIYATNQGVVDLMQNSQK